MEKRLSGPSWENISWELRDSVSAHTPSIASRSRNLRMGLDLGIRPLICCTHSIAEIAWKQDSGLAMCIFISFITILCGRLLNITKAVSSRNIQRNVLRYLLIRARFGRFYKPHKYLPDKFLPDCKLLPSKIILIMIVKMSRRLDPNIPDHLYGLA